jgi:tetratricopeptide (TPR) repeat protein
MDITLAQKAIGAALSGDWEEAVKINQEILKINPNDIDALNRLARAYSETGKISQAKETSQKVLAIDPVNTIASKCLEKWKTIKRLDKSVNPTISIDSFLEESGKTKHVGLLNIGDSKLFASLDPGEEVKLSAHSHRVSINTQDDKYIGRLPDDLSARLRNLIKAGNKYQVLIKSIGPKEITVFIRELEKGKDAPDISSFPAEKIEYVSFTPPELVHKETPDMDSLEETPEE